MSQTPSSVQEPRGAQPGSRDTADSDGGLVTVLDATLWERLSHSKDIDELATAWLALLCRSIDGARQGLLVLETGEANVFNPVAGWPDGAGKAAVLGNTATLALKERRGVVREAVNDPGRPAEGRGIVAAYPVVLDARVKGAVVVQVDQRPETDARLVLRQLQWGIAWILESLRSGSAQTQGRLLNRSGVALDIVGAALEHDGFKASAIAVVTELALRCNFDRVSLGFIERDSVAVSVISHSAQFGKQMNLVRCVGAAMDEAVDQRRNILYPSPSEQIVATSAHAELARLQGDVQILTLPLFSVDRFIGAMTFERSSEVPIDPEMVSLLEAAAAIVGPILEEKRRNDRWIGFKIVEAGVNQARLLIGPGHIARKLVAGIGTLALVFFLFAHQTYRADADAQIEGLVRRAVVAPYDGFIRDANARAGDTVHQDDVLASLDDRDMVLERLRWVTERQQRTFEYDKALASRQPSTINVTRSQIAQAEAQIQLLDEQLARVKMRAPIDGLIVAGDLSQMIGASATRGQVLFEIAPLTGYRVILSVDERQIGAIKVGQTGNLVTTALPSEPFKFVVEKLIPIAEVKDGKNTFRVEGRITDASGGLRPGMEGVAKIDVESRLLIWIWSKPFVDWLRIALWRWIP
jgi:hypothetical protein